MADSSTVDDPQPLDFQFCIYILLLNEILTINLIMIFLYIYKFKIYNKYNLKNKFILSF